MRQFWILLLATIILEWTFAPCTTRAQKFYFSVTKFRVYDSEKRCYYSYNINTNTTEIIPLWRIQSQLMSSTICDKNHLPIKEDLPSLTLPQSDLTESIRNNSCLSFPDSQNKTIPKIVNDILYIVIQASLSSRNPRSFYFQDPLPTMQSTFKVGRNHY